MAPQQYSRYERGENRITASMLYRLAYYFQQPISWFFQGFDDAALDVQSSVGDPQKDYEVEPQDKEELAMVSSNWQYLSSRQRQSILDLMNSMIDRP